jgi:uncharacterized protein (TIGR00369 family)
MTDLAAFLRGALEEGDPSPLAQAVPMARFLGIEIAAADSALLATMPWADHLMGNPGVPAIHGGAIGTLLESTAALEVLWTRQVPIIPRTITITIDYLRPALPRPTHAMARVNRMGRRVASVWVEAWQDDRARPVATAKCSLLLTRG